MATAVMQAPGPSDMALQKADSIFNGEEVTVDHDRWNDRLNYARVEPGVWFGNAKLTDVVGFFMSNILLSGNKSQVQKAWDELNGRALELVGRGGDFPQQVQLWNQWMTTMQEVLNATFSDPPQLRLFNSDGSGLAEETEGRAGRRDAMLKAGAVLLRKQKELTALKPLIEKLAGVGTEWEALADDLFDMVDVKEVPVTNPTGADVARSYAALKKARNAVTDKINSVLDSVDVDLRAVPGYDSASLMLDDILEAVPEMP